MENIKPEIPLPTIKVDYWAASRFAYQTIEQLAMFPGLKRWVEIDNQNQRVLWSREPSATYGFDWVYKLEWQGQNLAVEQNGEPETLVLGILTYSERVKHASLFLLDQVDTQGKTETPLDNFIVSIEALIEKIYTMPNKKTSHKLLSVLRLMRPPKSKTLRRVKPLRDIKPSSKYL